MIIQSEAGSQDHLGGRRHLRLRPAQLGGRSDRRLHPDAEPGFRRRAAATPPTPRPRPRARIYSSLFEEEVVLSAELEGGMIFSQDGTRITDRFSTGGDSFRGFARNGIGPRDFCGVGQRAGLSAAATGPQRSTTRSAATTTACCGSTRASRSAFRRSTASMAASSPTSARSGASTTPTAAWARSTPASTCARRSGFSLFVDTPFAPLRFTYAFPIQKESYDVVERFRFSIQTRF